MGQVDIDNWPVSEKPGGSNDHAQALRVLIDDVDCKIEQADGDGKAQDRLLDQRGEYMRELETLHASV